MAKPFSRGPLYTFSLQSTIAVYADIKTHCYYLIDPEKKLEHDARMMSMDCSWEFYITNFVYSGRLVSGFDCEHIYRNIHYTQ